MSRPVDVPEPPPDASGAPADPTVGADTDTDTQTAGGTPQSGRVHRQVEGINRQVEGIKGRYHDSSAEHVWSRLDRMDFINMGMLFAAILLLCFFPFMIVLNALAGRSTVTGLTRHLGLNHQAANDVSHLFTSSASTSSSLSVTSYVFFILGGIAAATAIQDLYERAFGLETRGMRDVLRRLAWLGVTIGLSLLASWAGPSVHSVGGPVLLALLGLVLLAGYWLFTQWFLLAGRVHWRDLVPPAVATALFWLGMEMVFTLTFSNTVISNNRKYGPIGIVFALMSFLIAIGVVIILGAVVGIVWRERGLSFRRAFERLRHRSGTAEQEAEPTDSPKVPAANP